jgi:hypothetical protein
MDLVYPWYLVLEEREVENGWVEELLVFKNRDVDGISIVAQLVDGTPLYMATERKLTKTISQSLVKEQETLQAIFLQK